MSDSRWSDVEADVEQALMHFGMAAIEIFEAGGFDDAGVEGYKATAAFNRGWRQALPPSNAPSRGY